MISNATNQVKSTIELHVPAGYIQHGDLKATSSDTHQVVKTFVHLFFKIKSLSLLQNHQTRISYTM